MLRVGDSGDTGVPTNVDAAAEQHGAAPLLVATSFANDLSRTFPGEYTLWCRVPSGERFINDQNHFGKPMFSCVRRKRLREIASQPVSLS